MHLGIYRLYFKPNVESLIKNYSSASTEEILKRTTGTMKNSVIDMEMKNDLKAKMIDLSWYSAIAGLVLILGLYYVCFIQRRGMSLGFLSLFKKPKKECIHSEDPWDGDYKLIKSIRG